MCRAEFREADMIQLDDTHRGEDRIPSGFKKKEGGVERLIWRKEVEAALFQRKTSLVLRQK